MHSMPRVTPEGGEDKSKPVENERNEPLKQGINERKGRMEQGAKPDGIDLSFFNRKAGYRGLTLSRNAGQFKVLGKNFEISASPFLGSGGPELVEEWPKMELGRAFENVKTQEAVVEVSVNVPGVGKVTDAIVISLSKGQQEPCRYLRGKDGLGKYFNLFVEMEKGRYKILLYEIFE